MPLLRCFSLLMFAAATACPLLVAPLAAQELPPVPPNAEELPTTERRPAVEAGRPGSSAQQRRQATASAADRQDVEALSADELLRRFDEVMRSAEATRSLVHPKPNDGAKPAEPAWTNTALRLVPEDLHLAKVYRNTKHVRYVAMRLWLVNTTATAVTVPLESIRLETRGDVLKPNQVPPQRGLPHVPFGGRLVPLRQLTTSGPITVPAGGTADISLAFFDLPGTGDVPDMTLSVPVGDDKAILDLNEYSRGLMRLDVERLGPGGLLGLLTIDGDLTPVGAGELAEVLQQLTGKQATRVVLVWGDAAPPPPSELLNWLVQTAMHLGTTAMNDRQHPVLSPDLVELHLASIPEGVGVPNYSGPRRVHDTKAEAVASALAGAYETIPLEILIEEIEGGHVLTRPAAVAAGERLPEDDLLLRLTDDADPSIAAAAVHALRGHGSPAAIEKLVALATSGREPISAAAVESLAASRYGAAHEALRELLDASADDTPVISPAVLVPVLADYPRPLWGDALHRLATQGDPAVRAEALSALARLGHPQLIDAFRAALASDDAALRQRAFTLVVWRGDDETQQLALDVTLEHLKSEPPTREMQLLLARMNEPRAVPLLLEHIEAGGPQRSSLVRLLVQIGGLEIREPLETIYPKLDRETQRQVLPTLADLKSSKFYEFAALALQTNDPALVSVAAQQLQADGGNRAVELLADVLFETEQPAILSYVANALAGIGTTAARQALRKADVEAGPRRDAAVQAWTNLQRQSAAWDLFMAGRVARQREKWQDAADRFTAAIEVDPQFVDAWEYRASARMQLQDYAGARADFERTLELDPSSAAAVTCLGILRIVNGEVEAGLSFVVKRAGEFGKNELFAYNTACLYAVAADRLDVSDAPRAARLRDDAVKELERSIELGMNQPESISWIRKDPDLKSLRGRDDFEKIVSDAEAKYGTEEDDGE